MIDRYLLRYFLAVIDQGNFSRAANHCNVSQPTLSVGIAKLEQALGVSLFRRSNQRVELTDAGARFQVHARRIEREFNLGLQAMRQSSDRGVLRVGILDSIPSDAIAAAVAATGQDSSTRLELIFGAERELSSRLAKQRIDLALTVVARGADKFVEMPIGSEGYGLALAAAHSLADRDAIDAEELADEVMIVRRHCEALSETSRHFLERGVRPHFAMRVSNDERTMRMVGAGLGLTVMPLSFRAPDVVRPGLVGFAMTRTLGWSTAPDNRHMLTNAPPFVEAVSEEIAKRVAR